MNKKNRYDKDFKLSAVKLVVEAGKKQAEVARDLGISNQTLSGWIKVYNQDKEESFVGSGNLKSEDKIAKEYQKQIRELEEENAILKKAMSIFAKSHK